MKPRKLLIGLLLLAAATGSAFADGHFGGGHFGGGHFGGGHFGGGHFGGGHFGGGHFRGDHFGYGRFGYGHYDDGGVFIGVDPWWGFDGWYDPPPAYYYSPPVATVEPPVYVEKGADTAAPAGNANNYWYYCPESRKYYPYAKECPRGWKRVAPTPPDAPNAR